MKDYSRIQEIKNQYFSCKAFRYSNNHHIIPLKKPLQYATICYNVLSLISDLEGDPKDIRGQTSEDSMSEPVASG